MEKEISSAAMLGIVLIAVAAIIGLGFGVFAIAKGTANEGVTGVQENLQAVSTSAYTDYDQKIVTGTQVVSAYTNFEGKSVAVLIATQATKDASSDSVNGIAGGSGVAESYTSAEVLPVAAAFNSDDTAMEVATSKNGNTQLKFVNYNAVIANADGNIPDINNNAEEATLTFDSNCWRVGSGFATSSGKVVMNNISGNLSKTGMMEYVPSGSRFQSYLIKDLSGTIMGVAFEQINNK